MEESPVVIYVPMNHHHQHHQLVNLKRRMIKVRQWTVLDPLEEKKRECERRANLKIDQQSALNTKSTDMLDPSISSTREAFRFPLHPPVAGGNYSYLKAEAVRCFYLHVGNACSMVG